MGVYHLLPEGDFKNGEPVLKQFDVYLDGSEVFGRVGLVAKMREDGQL